MGIVITGSTETPVLAAHATFRCRRRKFPKLASGARFQPELVRASDSSNFSNEEQEK